MASGLSSVVDRTDDCVQFVKYIAEWCHDLDTASVKERDSIRLKLGLESNDPIDIRKNVLSLLNEASPSSSASVKEPLHCIDTTIKKEMVATSLSRGRDSPLVLLDFNLSCKHHTWPTFVTQLDALLHMIWGDNPSNTVVKMKNKLLDELGGVKPPMIRCRSDLEKRFTQQYMATGFLVYERQIRWHGEVGSKENPELNDLLVPSKKKMVLLSCVFSFLQVNSLQFDDISFFMPPVYAKTTMGWQRTVYSRHNKSTTTNATFPEWIGADTFIGKDENISLLEVLNNSGTKFSPGGQLSAKNIIYYFVARTVDICKCSAEAGDDSNTLSQIQLYVGKSANEINRRWMVDRWAYCKVAVELVRIKSQCTNFPDYVKNAKKTQARLVDIYLTLAHLQKCQSALFVVHECKTKVESERKEAELISELNLVNMRFGLNSREEKKQSDSQ